MSPPLLGTQGTAIANSSIYLVRTWSPSQIQNSTRELIQSQLPRGMEGGSWPCLCWDQTGQKRVREVNLPVFPIPLEPLWRSFPHKAPESSLASSRGSQGSSDKTCMSFLWRGYFAPGEPAPHTGSDLCHHQPTSPTGTRHRNYSQESRGQ